MSEPELLRRIDWRFLLPSGGFGRMVLAGGSEEMAALLVRLGTARRVSLDAPAPGSADAVIVLAGSKVSVEDAAAWLAPGGVLCWEVDRRAALATTPDRAEARMRRAGLIPGEAYWSRGGPERCTMYLPLGAAGAPAWYFGTVFGAETLARRGVRALLRAATGWKASRFGRLVPSFTAVARAPGGTERGSVPAVLGTVLSGGGTPRPVLLLGGQEEWSRVTLLPFEGSSRAPAAVVKLPRVPRFNAETEHEQTVLARLGGALPVHIAGSIPEARGCTEWRGLRVSMESYLCGDSLARNVRGRAARMRAADDFTHAARWLADFHAETVSARPLLADEHETLVDQPLADYRAAFGADGPEAALLDAYVAHAERSARHPVPIAMQHRDFGPWNIRRAGHRLSVIDWEVARPGPALCDLLYLAMHWSWWARGSTDEAARRRDLCALFLPADPADELAATVRRAIAEYMARLDVHASLLPLLLVHTLVEQALDRTGRLRAGGDPRAGSRADNRYVGYLEALAAGTPLFPTPHHAPTRHPAHALR